MSEVKRLVYSFIQFLGDQLNSGVLSPDATESLEVAIQCLESAYGIDHATTEGGRSSLAVSRPLLEIFSTATQNEPQQQEKMTSEEDRRKAELLKNEGNELMKVEKFQEALELYNNAISLDASNAVFYCNRAAAYSKLNDHVAAINDCKKAIALDPSYSKAYGRMGLAHSNLNQHKEAKECYEKAVNLDPENDAYLGNLRVAEEKLRETNLRSPGGSSGSSGVVPGLGGGMPGGFDLGYLLNNPALMNMATQMMSDPNMQQMMNSMLSGTSNQQGGGGGGGVGGGGVGGAGGPGGPGFEALLQAGQQLAAQMQATNPNLVDQLRQQMNPNPDQPDSTGDSPNNQGL